jgi:hypothetical protein
VIPCTSNAGCGIGGLWDSSVPLEEQYWDFDPSLTWGTGLWEWHGWILAC